VNGKLSSTFAYWGGVLKSELGLIPRLYELIQVLWQWLTAETARADADEALVDAAEEQGEAAAVARWKQLETVSWMHSADVASLFRNFLACCQANLLTLFNFN
jgi:hypothetical protein